MNRADAKFQSENCAHHCVASLKMLFADEWNPNKFKCGVVQVADYLHRVLAQFSLDGCKDQHDVFVDPLLDAHGLLRDALCQPRVDRKKVAMANMLLACVASRSQSN